MPKIDEHCKSSMERTGKEFRELHTWMDAPREHLEEDHRRVRHDLSYIPKVIELFGKESVVEFLMHISEDYESTARKWGMAFKNDKEKEELRKELEELKEELDDAEMRALLNV